MQSVLRQSKDCLFIISIYKSITSIITIRNNQTEFTPSSAMLVQRFKILFFLIDEETNYTIISTEAEKLFHKI